MPLALGDMVVHHFEIGRGEGLTIGHQQAARAFNEEAVSRGTQADGAGDQGVDVDGVSGLSGGDGGGGR